jgi:hypothetical protein
MRNRHRCAAMGALLAAFLIAVSCPLQAATTETERQAIGKVVQLIVDDLRQKSFPDVTNVAVVPLRKDPDSYATDALRSAITRTQYRVFTRDDKEWDALLAEIEWGVRKEDVMDEATIQRFGSIEGVDAILFGQVWDLDTDEHGLFSKARISVHLADVETGQVLWGSGPVDAEMQLGWRQMAYRYWHIPAAVIAALIVLLVLRAMFRMIKRANRPL